MCFTVFAAHKNHGVPFFVGFVALILQGKVGKSVDIGANGCNTGKAGEDLDSVSNIQT